MNAKRLALIVAASAWFVAGCGGNGAEQAADTASEAETAQAQGTERTDPVEEKTRSIQENPNLSQEDTDLLTKWANYQTDHDPDAVYTLEDLPDWGNYRKLNFSKLSDEQMNLVIHELKTTPCPCPSCGAEWPVDRCLVAKPECNQGLAEAQKIIGRVRVLGQ